MQRILPGVYHWTTFHHGIGQPVHSYFISAIEPAILIDPRVPPEGLEWFRHHPLPRNSYLTNRHHYRHSRLFAALLGTEVWCHQKGLHEFNHHEKIHSFQHGEKLPGHVLALPVGALCDEETAFYIPVHGGILALGDSVVDTEDGLGFVPNELMGSHPEKVKRGLRAALGHILEKPFAHVLLAHGEPIIHKGHEALAEAIAA